MNILYAIIPYFNFINYSSGLTNLKRCIRELSQHQNVRIVLIEGVYRDNSLPYFSEKIFKHIKIPIKSVLWIKECLINIGFNYLPEDWEYCVWLDRDITFCNSNWPCETILQLKHFDIIQPWTQCFLLDENEQDTFKDYIRYSFCYSTVEKNINTRNTPYLKDPGQAWAINKTFYKKIKRLYEFCILGGADAYLAMCLDRTLYKYQFLDYFGRRNRDSASIYGISLRRFFKKFQNCRIGYINGEILHHYHGPQNLRSYCTREDVLIKNNFNPHRDLYWDENGVLNFKNENTQLEKDIFKYFLSRKEDGLIN